MSMTPNQPYMIRALYEWIIDNDMTPYVLVNAENEFAQVPRQYVDNGKIVLNLIPNAISNLELGNDHISFNARFSGKDTNVVFPVASVLAIYAKENGQGMVFDESSNETPPPEPEKPIRPSLKIVK
jgi:stringent starvation protein B